MKKISELIILLTILCILSIFIFYRKESPVLPLKNESNDLSQNQAVIENTTKAQIDIKTPKSKNKILVVQYNSTELSEEGNMPETEFYTFQPQEKNVMFSITPQKGTLITITLKNPQKEGFLKYQSLFVDGRKAFTIPQILDTEKTYDYTFMTKKNKEYKIELQWEAEK